MYKVYQSLWNHDNVAFYKAINHDWSKNVSELMFELKDKIQAETIDLIGRSYSMIYENVFNEMTNQTPDMLTECCKTLNWEITDGPQGKLILPKPSPIDRYGSTNSEDQLHKLTDFVSFLEN
jgi:COP9 signalosome complex subunit 8